MKRIIYQIGRFDINYKRNLRFVYKGKTYEKPLSSLVLKEHFESGAEVVLVYPISIVYNEQVINKLKCIDDFANKILCKLDSYLSNPKEVLKEHPHNKEADDFIVVHSLGKYKKPDGSGDVVFEGSYNDIVLGILCDLIKRYLKHRTETEFYFDISSGHNIYVSALLEAAKHLSVFGQLFNWLNKSLRPKIYIAFSDPILGSSAEEYEIYIEKLDFKAFFSSPLKKEDIEGKNKLSKKVFPDTKDENLKTEIRRKRKFLENFYIFFSALKNTTPLVFYHFEYDKYEDIVGVLMDIIETIKDHIYQNWQKSQNRIKKDDYLKAILTLGFYAGIVEVLSNKCVKKSFCGVRLYEIKEKFVSGENSIYKIFGLDTNIAILGNELYNLEKGYKVSGKTLKEIAPTNWEKLKKFLGGTRNDFDSRNFIAHAGFERTITEIRGDGCDLYLRYAKGSDENIKNTLKKHMGG